MSNRRHNSSRSLFVRWKCTKKHSFVVLDDNNGKIQSFDFDFVSLVMSSFKGEEQKRKKMAYPGNFPIVVDDVDVPGGNSKSGYIKAEQLYYFDKSKISYQVIEKVKDEIFNLLLEFIKELAERGVEFETITDNLK